VTGARPRAALLPLPPTPYLVVERTTRVVARDGLFNFEGRRYAVPQARPGERVELVLGDREIEVNSTVDGRRLAHHARGRPPRVLPDPVDDSVSLAQVLGALPDPKGTAGRFRSMRRRPVAELITERIRRHATELRLHGIADNPDEPSSAPRPSGSATASSSPWCSSRTSAWTGRSRCLSLRPAGRGGRR
jgi:hypothetical protein